MSAKLVEMTGIGKSFGGVKVLSDVRFEANAGDIIALCGENGAGKSTLMKILSGVYRMDEGSIVLEGEKLPQNLDALTMQRRGVSMIHQELNLMETLTVAQNIFLTREPKTALGLIDYAKMNREAEKLLTMLGQDISPTAHVSGLKIAQKQMVEIAKAISFKVKVLIMDEPTSMLTGRETAVLFDLIRDLSRQGIAVIYISHRLQEIEEICEYVTILRDGRNIITRKVAEVTQQEIASYMVGREIKESKAEEFAGNAQDIVLDVRHISDHMLKDISFKAARGEILGFSGLVGSGRSELMEMLFGVRKPRQGEVYIHEQKAGIKSPLDAIEAGLGFVTEDRKRTGLVLARDIRENANLVDLVKTRRKLIGLKRQQKNTEELIARLRIKCASQAQPVYNLSGGNQQKVVIAKWLLINPDILILDEPTRGIDVGAREEIYALIEEIAREGKTIVIVSSDLSEVLRICQRVLVMCEGRLMADLSGTDRNEETIMAYATGCHVEGCAV